MDEIRPKLYLSINLKDFSDFYWLKSELRNYCRLVGLSASGSKFELIEKISNYLAGTIKAKTQKLNKQPVLIASDYKKLNLNTKVDGNFKCSREIRNFFEQVVGKGFHFSVQLQTFIKANPGISFGEVIDEWRRQKEFTKNKTKKEIGPQFEYNQYFRDFFADPANKQRNREDCIEAWKKIRFKRGIRRYKPQNI